MRSRAATGDIGALPSSMQTSPTTHLKALNDAGVRGVRFNFVAHLGGAPDLDVFDRVLRRIEALGWHVVLHLDAQDIVKYADLIGRIRVPFVIDHMGRVRAEAGLDQEPFRQLLELMRNPLAWVKVCGSERVSAGKRPFDDAIPVRAGTRSRRSGSCVVGHGLATSEHLEGHAQRR